MIENLKEDSAKWMQDRGEYTWQRLEHVRSNYHPSLPEKRANPYDAAVTGQVAAPTYSTTDYSPTRYSASGYSATPYSTPGYYSTLSAPYSTASYSTTASGSELNRVRPGYYLAADGKRKFIIHPSTSELSLTQMRDIEYPIDWMPTSDNKS